MDDESEVTTVEPDTSPPVEPKPEHVPEAGPHRPGPTRHDLLAGLLVPGLGHWRAGLHHRAALFGSISLLAGALCLSLGLGQRTLNLEATAPRFFESLWVFLGCWVVSVIDLLSSLHEHAPPQPNPRVALLANLCSRGVGYFYLDRPLLGALSLTGLATWNYYTHDPCSGLPHPVTPLLHLLIGLHAYLLAQPRATELRVGRRVAASAALACVLLVGGTLTLNRLVARACSNLASGQEQASGDTAPSLVLSRLGMQLSLPSARWRLDGNLDSPLVSLRCPHSRVMVYHTAAPHGLGLEGFLVQLAGQLAGRHGEIHLERQAEWPAEQVRVREVTYTWHEADMLCTSHVFIAAQGDDIFPFLVKSEGQLNDSGRAEIARLVRSTRFLR